MLYIVEDNIDIAESQINSIKTSIENSSLVLFIKYRKYQDGYRLKLSYNKSYYMYCEIDSLDELHNGYASLLSELMVKVGIIDDTTDNISELIRTMNSIGIAINRTHYNGQIHMFSIHKTIKVNANVNPITMKYSAYKNVDNGYYKYKLWATNGVLDGKLPTLNDDFMIKLIDEMLYKNYMINLDLKENTLDELKNELGKIGKSILIVKEHSNAKMVSIFDTNLVDGE